MTPWHAFFRSHPDGNNRRRRNNVDIGRSTGEGKRCDTFPRQCNPLPPGGCPRTASCIEARMPGKAGRLIKSYTTANLEGFVFIDSLNGYQLQNGRLLQSADGAVTWNEMDIFGFGDVIGISRRRPGLGMPCIVFRSEIIFVNASPDGGQTWNVSLTESAFPDASPTAIFVRLANRRPSRGRRRPNPPNRRRRAQAGRSFTGLAMAE